MRLSPALETLTLVLVLAMLVGGCGLVASPIHGLIYTNIKTSFKVTDQKISKPRQMDYCAYSLLGLGGVTEEELWQKASEESFTKIATIDQSIVRIFSLIGKKCYILSGE